MSEIYYPDNWAIIKVDGDDPHYRVLAGWSGGYTTGDSWRMNSGIVSHEFDGDSWYFYGSSGSCYKCGCSSYGLRMNIAPIWEELKYTYGDMVKLLKDKEWWVDDWDWILSKEKDMK